jgi:hypothetical protein
MDLYQTWPHDPPVEGEEPYLFGVITIIPFDNFEFFKNVRPCNNLSFFHGFICTLPPELKKTIYNHHITNLCRNKKPHT